MKSVVISPVDFIDANIHRNELGQRFALFDFQREILRLAFDFDENGKLPYNTIIYSCPKKSGKTTIAGAVVLAWAFTQEAPNEIIVAANDLEQSVGRVFAAAVGLLKYNPALGKKAVVKNKTISLWNGTTITAIAGEYAGAAGSNHGLVSFDELWGFSLESSRRLYEELTPVPTRKNSIRFISTYAGFEGESELLWDLYKLGVGKDEHPDGQAERIHPRLPIYANHEARIFCYFDHEPRLPWQTPEYYAAQRKELRPQTYLRLHENRWATGAERFIDSELWDPCVDDEHRPSIVSRRDPIFVGIDIGLKHDNAARVAVKWDGASEKLVLVSHRIWKPTPGEPLDIEATIEADIRSLYDHGDLVEALIDPFQAHRSITTLQAANIPIREFPQTTGNCTLLGQTLFDLLKGRNLVLYPDEEMRQQALSTVAIEHVRGWRIAKEKSSKKIDAIVALALACVCAMENRSELLARPRRAYRFLVEGAMNR
ncbi:MAG TPA: hypothetical protein VNM15_05335 [Candidatus Binatia bacterium]|nr:hypothetical protein [Candidatus Binatia bacterium]